MKDERRNPLAARAVSGPNSVNLLVAGAVVSAASAEPASLQHQPGEVVQRQRQGDKLLRANKPDQLVEVALKGVLVDRPNWPLPVAQLRSLPRVK